MNKHLILALLDEGYSKKRGTGRIFASRSKA